jgi:CO/xanthine dehydrogenase FAD-binding subunit
VNERQANLIPAKFACRISAECASMLAPDELLTHVILPAPGAFKSGHYEVRYRESHDWPIAFATVLLTLNGATVQSARVVLGAVAPIPWRSPAAEQALVGKAIKINEETAAAADAALTDARRSARTLTRSMSPRSPSNARSCAPPVSRSPDNRERGCQYAIAEIAED